MSTGPIAGFVRVAGFCPACHADSLFLGGDGHICCGRMACPDQGAADRALAGAGTFTQCPVPAYPVLAIHYGDPASCVRCQIERAQMAAERTRS